MCNRTFCCTNCREKHEMKAHSNEELLHEKNQQKCDLCRGHPSLNFALKNDFQFILHLCEQHLPLRCKKCLTVNCLFSILFVTVSGSCLLSRRFLLVQTLNVLNEWTSLHIPSQSTHFHRLCRHSLTHSLRCVDVLSTCCSSYTQYSFSHF